MTHKLDYATPETARKSVVRWHCLTASATAGLWVLITYTSLFVIPRIAWLFRDFRTELPEPTKLVLGISRFMGSPSAITALALMAASTIAIGAYGDRKKPDESFAKHYAITTLITVLFAAVAYLLMLLLGTLAPLTSIMSSVSGMPRGT